MDAVLRFRLSLPPASLSPNARCFWAVKRRDAKAYRAEAAAAVRAAIEQAGIVTPWPAAHLASTFHFRTRHRRDRDGMLAGLKPVFDGLVDGGLLSDDAWQFLTFAAPAVGFDNDPRVEMVATRQEAALTPTIAPDASGRAGWTSEPATSKRCV